jgi:hypothetical protein
MACHGGFLQKMGRGCARDLCVNICISVCEYAEMAQLAYGPNGLSGKPSGAGILSHFPRLFAWREFIPVYVAGRRSTTAKRRRPLGPLPGIVMRDAALRANGYPEMGDLHGALALPR